MIRAALLLVVFALGCARVAVRSDQPLLRVGTSGDYAPFSLAADSDFRGFDIEVARRFTRDTGRRVEFVRFRWPDLLADLEAGRFDVAMSGVTIRPDRALIGTFTRPVTEAGAVVLVRPEYARSASRLDLMGMRIGVNRGGHLEQVARRLFPQTLLVLADDNQALPVLMKRGSVEAIVTDTLEADLFEAEFPRVRRVGPLTHDRKAYLARDPVLAAELDEWLRSHEADGSLALLRTETLGATRAGPSTRFDSDLNALLALVDLRLAFMPLVAAAKAHEGRAITDRAQETRVLDAARADAVRTGLDPERATAFCAAQMAAARAVQRAAAGADASPTPPSLDRALRPAIARVSTAITEQAARVAMQPSRLRALSAPELADRLDAMTTPVAERAAIVDALLALRPAAGPGAVPPGATTDR